MSITLTSLGLDGGFSNTATINQQPVTISTTVVVYALSLLSATPVTSVTDDGGNVYTKLISGSLSNTFRVELWGCLLTTNSGTSITVTWAGNDVIRAFANQYTIGESGIVSFGAASTSLLPNVASNAITIPNASYVTGVFDVWRDTVGPSYVINETGFESSGSIGSGNDVAITLDNTADTIGVVGQKSYTIVAVNQGTKTFTVAGTDAFTEFNELPTFIVSGSTGNNGTYTLVDRSLNGANTDIRVAEVIPSATADGVIVGGILQTITMAAVRLNDTPVVIPSCSRQITNGGWQDSLGNPLALGYVTFRLITDAKTTCDQQIMAGRIVTVPLDSNGNVAGTVFLSTNDTMTPTGTVYVIKAYTATGQFVWGGEKSIPSGVGVLDLNNW